MNDLEILAKEVNNEGTIYLYKKGNSWKAYEQSAYLLSQIALAECVEKEVWTQHELVVATASIKAETLASSQVPHWMLNKGEVAIIDGCCPVADELLCCWKERLELK